MLNAEVDAVCEDYERRLLDVVETYGMNAETFNEISNDLVDKQSLRKKVLLQAFYYKLAADLQGNIAGSRKPLGKKANTEKNNRHVDVEIKVDRRADKRNKAKEPNHLFKFVRALKEVEADRLRVRAELLNELKIREFPKDMCSPTTLPAMSPAIQRACEQFPENAEKIIQKHGLEVEQFTEMLEKTKNNILYKGRVFFELSRLK